MHPVDFTNDPPLAGQNDKLHAINGTLQVDLIGSAARRAWATCPTPDRRPGPTSSGRRTARRRQGDHRRAVDREGRHHVAHRADARARHPCDDGEERRQLRGHRIRRRPAARQDGAGACPGLIGIAHPDFRAELTNRPGGRSWAEERRRCSRSSTLRCVTSGAATVAHELEAVQRVAKAIEQPLTAAEQVGTRLISISSTRPAARYCWPRSRRRRATRPGPAARRACASAASMPSVTNVNVVPPSSTSGARG